MNIAVFGSRKDIVHAVLQDGEQLIAVFGSTEVDLSSVDMPEALHWSALAMFGSCQIIVPRGTEVVFRGFALFGSQEFKRQHSRSVEERGGVLYLNSVAFFGSVEVVEAEE
jgi:predicted membrane protein